MNTHADKVQDNKSQFVANGVSQKQSGIESTFQFADNRTEAIAQRKLYDMANGRQPISSLQLDQFADKSTENVMQMQDQEVPTLQMKGIVPGIVIQRALNGTYAALISIEPEKGFRFGKTHGTWTDLLQAVDEYERLEARPGPTGNIGKYKAFKKELDKGLDNIEKYANKWISIHENSLLAEQGVNETMESGDLTNVTPNVQGDLAQLSAARNLLRRVVWERSEISQANPKKIGRAHV